MTLRTFPTLAGLAFPVIKTPTWKADVQRSFTGKVTALSRYSYPIYGWELPYTFLRSDVTNKEWQTLVAFYNLVNGQATPFLFVDPNDTVATAQSFGTGDGATKSFQLLRSIVGSGSNTWLDPVYAPLGTPQIFDSGVLKATPADYSIDATGMVTFVVAPSAGNPLTWTGTFAWVCRFSDASASFENFAFNFWELKAIKFSSEKL